MMLLVLALLFGGLESMRPVELGPSPAASEVLAPMAKKVDSEQRAGKAPALDDVDAQAVARADALDVASFVQDPRGELLVRLWIGEARTSWGTVPAEVSGRDLELARELLNRLLDAFEVNDRAAIGCLEDVVARLRGSTSRNALLVQYLEFISSSVRIHRMPEPFRIHPSVARDGLIRWFGNEFERISLDRFCEVMDRVAGRAGGRGRIGVRTAAAMLMVEAEAFGFERCQGEALKEAVADAKEELRMAAKRLRQAAERARGRSSS